MLGKLRIAASVFFGLLAVAVCVLWVRSYRHEDEVSRVSGQGYFSRDCESFFGTLSWAMNWTPNCSGPRQSWHYATQKIQQKDGGVLYPPEHHWVFDYRSASGIYLRSSHWFVAFLCGGMSGILSRKRQIRSSLRTLLIATTLVAFVLGLAAVF